MTPRTCSHHSCSQPATWMFGPSANPDQSVYCDGCKERLKIQHEVMFPSHTWQRLQKTSDDKVWMRCPVCGMKARGRPHQFKKSVTCPKCKAERKFVPLSQEKSSAAAPEEGSASAQVYLDVLEQLKPLTDFTRILPNESSEWEVLVDCIVKLVQLGTPQRDDLKAAYYYGLGKAIMCVGGIDDAATVFRMGLEKAPQASEGYRELRTGKQGTERMPPDVRRKFLDLELQLDDAAREKLREFLGRIS